jgi:CHAT domain-containing protein
MKSFMPPVLLLYLQVLLPLCALAQKGEAVAYLQIDSLIDASREYTAAAEFEAAFAASAAAGEIAIACCGEQSAAYASYCFNEGRIRYFMGRNEEAITWYLVSKNLRGQILGEKHLDYGKSLNNLAIVYDVLGRFTEAEILYLKVLEVREANAGKQSLTYANALDNLAALYNQIGNYEKAEIRILEAKDIRESLVGTADPQYAKSLINLATLNYQTNNFSRAEYLYLEAKAIYEAQEELDYYTYITIVDNLGALFLQLGAFNKAEAYYTEAANLRYQILGTENEGYALSLNHLAAVYKYTNRLGEAEGKLQESLAILGRIKQDTDVDYAYCLQDLGDLYMMQGKYQKARKRQQHALKILDRRVNKSHPRYLQGLRGLAKSEWMLGHDNLAATLLRDLAQLEEKTLASAVRHLSEEELANYTEDFKRSIYQYFAVAERYPELADICYDKIMVYKGFLENAVLQLNRLAQTDSSILAQYHQLQGLNARLARMYVAPVASSEEISALELEARTIEKSIVRRGALLGNALRQVRWHEVQQQLEPGQAAIEFVHYQTVDEQGRGITRYLALLLHPEAPLPIFIPLFEEQSLTALLDKGQQPVVSFVNNLYSADEEGNALYDLIWQPIALALEGLPEADHFFYSSTGLLHRINLGAIPMPSAISLAEQYHFRALGSTRQLVVRKEDSDIAREQSALLYGSINYGEPEKTISFLQENNEPLVNVTTENKAPAGNKYRAEDNYWRPLLWTEVEVMIAKDLLEETGITSILKMGDQATETSLKAIGGSGYSPRVLHLATHGFFFPDPEELGEDDALAYRVSARSMIRSGLVLADGNYAWAYGQPRLPNGEDGILTAYEVSKMSLRETELVILSACETGLGDIKGTEGVYGLQRAFKIAGARYLVMTLWQVPDFQAQAFMSTFYLAWLNEGKTIPEAFQSAQRYMQARYEDAFQWAGFILVE